MSVLSKIKELSRAFTREIIEIRRHLHAYPELSFEESETASYIITKLEELGIPYKKGYAGNGIVGWIDGKQKGRVIALRADMDALPVNEINNLSFKSKNEGKMHACGHDVHTACLIGAGKILLQLRENFNGRVKLVFQPAEEKLPGGAKTMLSENALLPDEPEIMLAQHVFPDMETGYIGFKEGMYMASSDEIYITVKGKGGHAALPEKLADPVVAAANLITALQIISSRYAPPGIPTVLSFGKVTANGAVNIIPDEVAIEGTFRTMDEKWRARAHDLIVSICKNTVNSFGAEADVEIRKGYPALINDAGVTRKAIQLAGQYMGNEKVKNLDIRMTSEDFAYFADKYPSVLYRLGTTTPGKQSSPLHSSKFLVDENSIETGTGLMAWLALGFLENDEPA